MITGAFPHISHAQCSSALNAVDTLVFCTMIHIRSADILHGRDQCYIENEDSHADTAFHNGQQCIGYNKFPKKSGQEVGKQHEDQHCHDHRKCHGRSHHYFLCLLTKQLQKKFLKFSRLCLFFLILIKACGPGQSLHSQDHRIYKIHHSPDQRQLRPGFVSCNTNVLVSLYLDLAVRSSHGYGVLALIFHHNAFQHCLTAYS